MAALAAPLDTTFLLVAKNWSYVASGGLLGAIPALVMMSLL